MAVVASIKDGLKICSNMQEKPFRTLDIKELGDGNKLYREAKKL